MNEISFFLHSAGKLKFFSDSFSSTSSKKFFIIEEIFRAFLALAYSLGRINAH